MPMIPIIVPGHHHSSCNASVDISIAQCNALPNYQQRAECLQEVSRDYQANQHADNILIFWVGGIAIVLFAAFFVWMVKY